MLNRASSRSADAFEKVKAFIADIKSESKCCQIPCDLQDFASVRSLSVSLPLCVFVYVLVYVCPCVHLSVCVCR